MIARNSMIDVLSPSNYLFLPCLRATETDSSHNLVTMDTLRCSFMLPTKKESNGLCKNKKIDDLLLSLLKENIRYTGLNRERFSLMK